MSVPYVGRERGLACQGGLGSAGELQLAAGGLVDTAEVDNAAPTGGRGDLPLTAMERACHPVSRRMSGGAKVEGKVVSGPN